MHKSWRWNVVVGGCLVCCVLAGCAVDPVEPQVQVSETQQAFAPDEEVNGRTLVGAAFEDARFLPPGFTEYFNVSTVVGKPEVEVVTFVGGASLVPLRGLQLKGMVLSSGDMHLKIVGIRPDGNITHYTLEAAKGDQPYAPLCANAIPLYGTIDRTGAHLPTEKRVTFVCDDGDGAAGAKCARFGYPAGRPGSPLWGAHQACMQMLEADYCGIGIPNTRTGTRIEFYDDVGVNQVPLDLRVPMMDITTWPPGPNEYYFEAAFRGTHGPAACNARSRWPLITSNCVAAIPDCPIATNTLISNPWNATLLVASKFNQLLLHRWRSNGGNGADRVTTVSGYHNANDAEERPPWPGYAYAATEGVLLRVPPAIVPQAGITAVSVYRRGASDMFVAKSDDAQFSASVYTRVVQEGYVYNSPADVLNPQALRLYQHSESHDLLSSTADPDGLHREGYEPYPDEDSNLIGFVAGLPGQ
jgi:hypothetical protein